MILDQSICAISPPKLDIRRARNPDDSELGASGEWGWTYELWRNEVIFQLDLLCHGPLEKTH